MAKQKPLTLADLLAAAEAAAATAAEAKTAAEAADATDEVKAKAESLAQAADDAQAAYDQAKAAADEAEAAAAAAAAPAEPEAAAAAAPAEPEASAAAVDDPAFVPVFKDEDGEPIPRNSIIRVVTTTGLNLRSLDGELITPEPTMELKGPDVRRGDWYTVQYEAGLIAVHSVKKLK